MENPKNEIFAKRLKELREIKNLTQQDVATAGETTKTTISSYESGGTTPNCEILSKIAKAYNVSMNWLCGLSEEKGLEIRTYSDLFRCLLKIDDIFHIRFGYVEELEEFRDSYSFFELSIPPVMDNVAIVFDWDATIVNFIVEWNKMRDLKSDKTIDNELYSIWLEKKLNDYDTAIKRDE